MPLSHSTKVYAVKDAKIAPLTADPEGGTTTYGSLIDVPGIRTVGVGGDIENIELRGDQTLLDSDTFLNSITVEFEYAKLNLDALEVWLGGSTADGGSGSTETATWSLLGTDTLFGTWKFEAQVTSVDTPTGDLHIVLYKCKLSDFPEIGTELDDYQIFSVAATASPRLSDAKWIDVVLNEQETAIA